MPLLTRKGRHFFFYIYIWLKTEIPEAPENYHKKPKEGIKGFVHVRFINKNFQFSAYFWCFYWGSSLSILEFNCSASDFFVGKSHGASDAETISFGTTQKLCLGFAVVLVFVGRDYQKWVPSLLGSVPPAARGWDLSSNQAFLGCLGYSKQKWIFPNCSAVWVTCPCIIEGSVMASKQHRPSFLARKRHA